ncbi:hypothetical protein [Knoellia sp. LjRoot47]|uniref:hypothetical protein n=1 Tax=Knoellia sp. LjRoot47 TaxID=3342330 RepID=UPI003ECE35C4
MSFTVTGRLERPDSPGTPQAGTLVFTPTPGTFIEDDSVNFGDVEVELDEQGAFSVELKWKPGMVWHVRFRYVATGFEPFTFEAPKVDGATIDLLTVTPVQVPTGIDPARYVAVPVPGGEGGAVASVNGQTGAVVLTAATVGAATTTQGAKADTASQPGHVQPANSITDLAETVRDLVAAFVVAGSGVVVTHDDAGDTFTITATGGGGGDTDPEIVRDVIGSALVAGTGVQIVVNDAGDSITVSSTAVQPTRQIATGAGLLGGGDLSANRSLSVDFSQVATAAQGDKADSAVQPAALTTEATARSDGDAATLTAAQEHAQALVNALTAASPATLDTLAEIAAALGNDPNLAATLTAALGKRVRVDAAQSLSTPEQAQARANIGAGTSSFDGAYGSLSGRPTLGTAAATASSDYAPATHNHDSRYFTETEADGRFVRTVNGTGPDGAGNVVVSGEPGPAGADGVSDVVFAVGTTGEDVPAGTPANTLVVLRAAP